MNYMSKWELIDDILKPFYKFLKLFINPFLAGFFTVINYYTLTDKLEITDPWRIAFLIISAIYFFFSLGLAVFVAIRNTR